MHESLNKPRPSRSWAPAPSASPPPRTCWNAAWSRSCSRPAPQVGHAVRQWGHVQLFSPWEYNIDKAAERLLAAAGWNSPAPDQYPTGGELVEQLSRAAGHAHAAQDHIRTSSLVTSVGRAGFDKMKTNGPRLRALRNPLPERQGPGAAQGRRGDRRLRHLASRPTRPAPTACRPSASARPQDRIAYGMPDVLGRDRGALCRPDRRRARRRPLRHRHADRPRAARRTKRRRPRSSGCCAATIPTRRSAAAPTTSSPPAASWARPSPRW